MKKLLIIHTLTTVFFSTLFLTAAAQNTQYSDLTLTEVETGTAIEWTTFNEENTTSFIIEKSSDAVNFTELATLGAVESDTEKNDYFFFDLGLSSKGEAVHYRVKSIDSEGALNYGKTVSITKMYQNHFSVNSFDLTESPNEYVLYCKTLSEGDMKLDIVNNDDNSIVHTEVYNATIGINKFNVNLNDLAAGNYQLVFELDDELESIAVTKEEEERPANLMSRKSSKSSRN